MPNDVMPINEFNRIEGIHPNDVYRAAELIKDALIDDFVSRFVEDCENQASMETIEYDMWLSDDTGKGYETASPENSLISVAEDTPYVDLMLDDAIRTRGADELGLDWYRARTRIEDYLNHSMYVCAGENWETTKIEGLFAEHELVEVVGPYPAVAEFDDAYACWLPDPEMLATGNTDFDYAGTIWGHYTKP